MCEGFVKIFSRRNSEKTDKNGIVICEELVLIVKLGWIVIEQHWTTRQDLKIFTDKLRVWHQNIFIFFWLTM